MNDVTKVSLAFSQRIPVISRRGDKQTRISIELVEKHHILNNLHPQLLSAFQNMLGTKQSSVEDSYHSKTHAHTDR